MSDQDNCEVRQKEIYADAERHHNKIYSYIEKSNDAAISSGAAAIKNLFLMNGGALVAMLAFISSILSKENPQTFASNLVGPMFWFAIGLASAAAASAGTYFTNLLQAIHASKIDFSWDYPFIKENHGSQKIKIIVIIFHIITIVIAGASLAFFVKGFFEVKGVFDAGMALSEVIGPAAPPDTPAGPQAPAGHTPPAP